VLLFVACSPKTFQAKWTKEIAPENYVVRFETTKGDFEVAVTRKWSPLAADRFYQLAKHDYYVDAIYYRVIPNFVAQFGNTDTIATRRWAKHKIKDEPVIRSNTKGTLSFARGGKDDRVAELFINLQDNIRLDTINYNNSTGFPVFGEVTKGMDVVDQIYSGYDSEPLSKLDQMYTKRNAFLAEYPKLDRIKKVVIISKNAP